MADLDDILEAALDIEDIVEEVVEPGELLEDFIKYPLTIAVAVVAAIFALVTLFLLFVTVVLLVFAIGFVEVLVLLTVLGLLATVGMFGLFLYIRTDVPRKVREKIEDAREQADDTPTKTGTMTEQEAIDELGEQYASGNLNDREMEEALEEVLTSERPEEVVRKYSDGDAVGDAGSRERATERE